MDKQINDIKNISNLENKQGNSTKTNSSIKNNSNQEERIDNKNMLKFLQNKMKDIEVQFDLEENIVIDLGHAYAKIGFSGEDLPRMIIPSIFSSLKKNSNSNEINLEKNTQLYGYKIFSEKDRDLYETTYLKPGDHETEVDKNFYSLLEDYFKNENIIPSDYNLLVNCSPIKNKKNILALTKLFLEDFNFKGLSIVNSSSLSLFSTGKTSGLVVDSGESKTMCVPIYEGFPLYHALNISSIGGKNISDIILEGIVETYPEFDKENVELIREVKQKMCKVPFLKDYDFYMSKENDILNPEEKLYKLPDETTIIEVSKESRLKASELIFK